jgi:hypothetical protein
MPPERAAHVDDIDGERARARMRNLGLARQGAPGANGNRQGAGYGSRRWYPRTAPSAKSRSCATRPDVWPRAGGGQGRASAGLRARPSRGPAGAWPRDDPNDVQAQEVTAGKGTRHAADPSSPTSSAAWCRCCRRRSGPRRPRPFRPS